MKMIFCAALALIENGKVLMATRPDGKEFSGLWEFPGGKLEPNETPEDALVREIKEELEIELDKKELIPYRFSSLNFGEKHITMLLYLCTKHKGNINPKEQQKYDFKDLNSLNKLKVPPLDEGLLIDIKKIMSKQVIFD